MNAGPFGSGCYISPLFVFDVSLLIVLMLSFLLVSLSSKLTTLAWFAEFHYQHLCPLLFFSSPMTDLISKSEVTTCCQYLSLFEIRSELETSTALWTHRVSQGVSLFLYLSKTFHLLRYFSVVLNHNEISTYLFLIVCPFRLMYSDFLNWSFLVAIQRPEMPWNFPVLKWILISIVRYA